MAKRIISGVYAVVHKPTGRVYIGSSVKLWRRRKEHLQLLKKNRHRTHALQDAWNRDGADAFEWRVLEYIEDAGVLLAAEQRWIDLYDATNAEQGFNRAPQAGSNTGIKMPPEVGQATSERMKGHKPSPETCALISAKAMGNQRRKGLHSGKLTESDVIEIKKRLAANEFPRDIAKAFSVSQTAIWAIARGASWWHITLPEAEEGLINQRSHPNLGSGNKGAKLTEQDVREIKRRLANGEAAYRIAKDYPVSDTAIRKIKKGLKWKHVTLQLP